MTPNIKQNVIPRRSARPASPGARSSCYTQRGSVEGGTVTLAFGFLALVLIGGLGLFYLQQVINTASQGTDIHALESKVIDLHEKQRELELEGAGLRSLQTVENNINELNLVATDKVSYLVNQPSHVARAGQ